jgi:hypothetical protein
MKIGIWKMRNGLLARVEKYEEGTEWPWKGYNEKGEYLSWAEDGSRVGSTSVPYDDDLSEYIEPLRSDNPIWVRLNARHRTARFLESFKKTVGSIHDELQKSLIHTDMLPNHVQAVYKSFVHSAWSTYLVFCNEIENEAQADDDHE